MAASSCSSTTGDSATRLVRTRVSILLISRCMIDGGACVSCTSCACSCSGTGFERGVWTAGVPPLTRKPQPEREPATAGAAADRMPPARSASSDVAGAGAGRWAMGAPGVAGGGMAPSGVISTGLSSCCCSATSSSRVGGTRVEMFDIRSNSAAACECVSVGACALLFSTRAGKSKSKQEQANSRATHQQADPGLQRLEPAHVAQRVHQAVLERRVDVEAGGVQVRVQNGNDAAGQQVANGGQQLLEGEARAAHDRVVRRRQRGQAIALADGMAEEHHEGPAGRRRVAGRGVGDTLLGHKGLAACVGSRYDAGTRALLDRRQAEPLLGQGKGKGMERRCMRKDWV